MPYKFKYEIACQYFPFVEGKTALRYLMRELRRRPDLMRRLEEAGFTQAGQRFSPREQAIIIEELGEP